MPPQLIFDISNLDLSKVLYRREQIQEFNPQRGDMAQLDSVVHIDVARKGLIGVKYVRDDEFWVSGHIPGRPLLPGVLMIEAAAQLSCFFAKKYLLWKGFVGFNGVEDVKFRMQVPPGKTLYLLGVLRWERHRRLYCEAQGVVDGNLAFEAGIIGVEL